MKPDTEEWRPVVGNPGYQVSNLGRVKKNKYIRPDGRVYAEKILTQATTPNGYSTVCIYKPGQYKVRRVHLLVMHAFVGPCPEGMQCRHLDGVPSNPKLSNLKWGTPAENQADRVLHGTSNRGVRNHFNKLTLKQVSEIRTRCDRGEFQKDVAADYGVGQSNVSAIMVGKIWNY